MLIPSLFSLQIVRTVANYHKDMRERERRAEKEGQQKLRRTASNIARQIRVFWSNIGKVCNDLLIDGVDFHRMTATTYCVL